VVGQLLASIVHSTGVMGGHGLWVQVLRVRVRVLILAYWPTRTRVANPRNIETMYVISILIY
jgi:hypothetical protein